MADAPDMRTNSETAAAPPTAAEPAPRAAGALHPPTSPQPPQAVGEHLPPTNSGDAAGDAGEPETGAPTRAQEMLLNFLREHDAACPLCGYNVRALTRPVCPECRQELTLTVGVLGGRLRMGLLFAAVAPGFFSGIAALFVLIPTLGRPLFGDGRWEPLIVALDLFGWCSGALAIIIAAKRHRFLALPRARQRWYAIIIWLVHIGALGMFILLAVTFL